MCRSEEGGHARRTIRPERVLALGFLLLILLGAGLLYLPVSVISGVRLSAGEALFTATSAVCVTGLVAVDTGTTFSLFGQMVPLAPMQDATKVIFILLMIVGANPASTGGIVKTTTVAVLLLAVRAEIRGEEDVTLLSRRLPAGLIRRALAVVTVAGMVLLTGTLTIMVLEGGCIPFVDVLLVLGKEKAIDAI